MSAVVTFKILKKKRNEKENKKEKSLAIYKNIIISKSNRGNKRALICFFAVSDQALLFYRKIYDNYNLVCHKSIYYYLMDKYT